MSAEENKAVIRRWLDVWNTGAVEELEALITPDYVRHTNGSTERPEAAPAWYGRLVTTARTIYPDFHVTADVQLAEGDMVVTRWTVRGTHQGEWNTPLGTTLAPTGKQVTFTGVTIARLANGAITEEWWESDRLGRLQHLGALPTATA